MDIISGQLRMLTQLAFLFEHPFCASIVVREMKKTSETMNIMFICGISIVLTVRQSISGFVAILLSFFFSPLRIKTSGDFLVSL